MDVLFSCLVLNEKTYRNMNIIYREKLCNLLYNMISNSEYFRRLEALDLLNTQDIEVETNFDDTPLKDLGINKIILCNESQIDYNIDISLVVGLKFLSLTKSMIDEAIENSPDFKQKKRIFLKSVILDERCIVYNKKFNLGNIFYVYRNTYRQIEFIKKYVNNIYYEYKGQISLSELKVLISSASDKMKKYNILVANIKELEVILGLYSSYVNILDISYCYYSTLDLIDVFTKYYRHKLNIKIYKGDIMLSLNYVNFVGDRFEG